MKAPPRTFDRIESARVLLVDGNDELNFYAALLNHMGLYSDSQFQMYQPSGSNEQAKTRICGGLTVLSADGSVTKALPNLKATYTGFSRNVSVLGIITDAEKSSEDRLRSVQNALRRGDLPVCNEPLVWVNGPPKTGVLIQPPGKPAGMIEDMCLESIAGRPVLECIEEFFQCATTRGKIDEIHQESKARVRSFLATCKDPDKSVGAAALAHYWDFDAQVWEPVRKFLRELCS